LTVDLLKSVLNALRQNSRWSVEASASLNARAIIRSVVPRELADGVSASLPDPGVLVISCQNSLIASRIRHIVPSLKDKLKTAGIDVKVIQVDVTPSYGSSYRPKRAPNPAPEAAVEALDALADRQGDADFARALKGLAQRLRDVER
jgi:hypothetical protein